MSLKVRKQWITGFRALKYAIKLKILYKCISDDKLLFFYAFSHKCNFDCEPIKHSNKRMPQIYGRPNVVCTYVGPQRIKMFFFSRFCFNTWPLNKALLLMSLSLLHTLVVYVVSICAGCRSRSRFKYILIVGRANQINITTFCYIFMVDFTLQYQHQHQHPNACPFIGTLIYFLFLLLVYVINIKYSLLC